MFLKNYSFTCNVFRDALPGTVPPLIASKTLQSRSIVQRMDVARFSQDNFDPKEWINSTLQTEPGQSKEAAAGSLVMKLQLMIARINSALEEQCSAVVQSVPRIVREAEQLEQEAGLLRDKLVGVKADVAKVEAETAENMGALVRMDLVKERIAGTIVGKKQDLGILDPMIFSGEIRKNTEN